MSTANIGDRKGYGRHRTLLKRELLRLCRCVIHFSNLLQQAFTFYKIFATYSAHDTRIEMFLENQGRHFVESSLHCLYLSNDINTISVFFHHADYAVQMSI